MEYLIKCQNKTFFLVYENGEIKEKNHIIYLTSSIDSSFDFDLVINDLKVRVDDNKLIIYDEEHDYLVLSTPRIIEEDKTIDGLYDVNLNQGTLHFILKGEETIFNNHYSVETKIEKLLFEEEIVSQDIIYNFATKERIVRKKVARFIQKLLEYAGYPIDYTRYKAIIYREKPCVDELDLEIKNIYDAYLYFISDYPNILTEHRLKRFFYLLLGKEMDDQIISKIVDTSYANMAKDYLFRSSSLLKLGLDLFSNSSNKIEKMIPLMLMNAELIRSGLPSTMICYRDYQYFQEIDLQDESSLQEFIERIIAHNTYQEKKYYLELTELDFQKIKESILLDEDMLKTKYHLEHLYVFGSFAKDNSRIDSDLDFALFFMLDATSSEIEFCISYLKNKYLELLKRNIDVMVLYASINDEKRLMLKAAKGIF